MLMVTSVASMIKQFNMDNIAILQDLGYQVHVATNFERGSTMSAKENQQLKFKLNQIGVIVHQIDFPRGIGNPKIFYTALRQLSKIVKNNGFKFIHCHSTIGGICSRLVGHRQHIQVIYTAHGFQFFKGSSYLSWLLVYPIEKYLSYFTDVLITINKEDFELSKAKLHAKKILYVPGIGIDVDRISNLKVDKQEKRSSLGIPQNAIIVLSVGELSDRKNHSTVLKAVSTLKNYNIYYVVCGIGDNKDKLLSLAKEKNFDGRLKLLGYRTDIVEIMKASDLFVFPSLLEGLPVSLMEAMAAGLPIIASNIRGNTDLIKNGKNGYLFNPNDIKEIQKNIIQLINNQSKMDTFCSVGQKEVTAYDKAVINKYMNNIYASI